MDKIYGLWQNLDKYFNTMEIKASKCRRWLEISVLNYKGNISKKRAIEWAMSMLLIEIRNYFIILSSESLSSRYLTNIVHSTLWGSFHCARYQQIIMFPVGLGYGLLTGPGSMSDRTRKSPDYAGGGGGAGAEPAGWAGRHPAGHHLPVGGEGTRAAPPRLRHVQRGALPPPPRR